MSFEQLIGVVVIAVGIYFVICSTVKRDFILYRLKVALAIQLYGEAITHGFYLLTGVATIFVGIVKVTGYL